MPSSLHEVLVEMFRVRPALAAEMLSGPLELEVPDFQRARLSAGELNQVAPTEYRADLVVTLDRAERHVLAVVVEVQLGVDGRKRRSWPAYVATLHARLGCQVALLVVAPSPSVAAWCAEPIPVGHPGFVLTPSVLGPSRVPVVTDQEAARQHPELAVLSTIAHGSGPKQEQVFAAFAAGLITIDEDLGNMYADVVLAALPTAAGRRLKEILMSLAKTYEYQSDFARRYYSQGKAQGEAAAVLAVLAARGIDVPDKVRETITTCTDLDQLESWVRRAATATTVDDLFS